MIRALALALLCTGCVTHRDTPAQYDFDAIEAPADPRPRLDAAIAVPEVTAPSWMRTPQLFYRLDYRSPARPQAYAHSQWAAPPAELVSLRLRELLRQANAGFTTSRFEGEAQGYRVEVALEEFMQNFTSTAESHCVVTLSVMVVDRHGRIVAERGFHAERLAPTPDAAGAVRGLVQATDESIARLLDWLPSVIQASSFDTPRTR